MTDTILVDDRPDGTYILVEGTHAPTRYQKSNEALHTCLAATGWKRIGKQQGSLIGGMYWLPGSFSLPVLVEVRPASQLSDEAFLANIVVVNEELSDDEELSFFDHEELSDDEGFDDDPSDLGFDPYAGQYLDDEPMNDEEL